MKQDRLIALDGLRGVAAICVALMHLQVSWLPRAHAYLAVDLFFVLSGFVIARSYEQAFAAGMRSGKYLLQRVERLYPMLLLGSAIGLATYFCGISQFAPVGRLDLTLAIIGQLLLIPYISSAASLAFNGALWSISYELVANAAHRIAFPLLSPRRLWAVLGLAWALLAYEAHHYGTLHIGWTLQTVAGGVARVAFGFSLGIVLFRTQDRWQPAMPRVPFALLAIVLVLATNCPTAVLGRDGSAIYDIAMVTAVFPSLVMVGAVASGGGVSRALGTLSFPLYAIHQPLVEGMHRLGAPDSVRLAGLVMIIAVAWALGQWVDEPLNRWRRAQR